MGVNSFPNLSIIPPRIPRRSAFRRDARNAPWRSFMALGSCLLGLDTGVCRGARSQKPRINLRSIGCASISSCPKRMAHGIRLDPDGMTSRKMAIVASEKQTIKTCHRRLFCCCFIEVSVAGKIWDHQYSWISSPRYDTLLVFLSIPKERRMKLPSLEGGATTTRQATNTLSETKRISSS